MKKIRFIALLLVIFIFTTSLSMFASAASNDIFFASDVHGKTSNLNNVLSAVKKDTAIGVVALAGDYELSVSQLDSSVKSAFPDAIRIYTTGNHDTNASGLQKTGEALVNEHFSIYMIAQGDFKNTNTVNTLKKYLATYNTNANTAGKPLFVVCHMPLHDKRNDNTNADKYANLLNEYGTKMDIIYVFGHNHSVEKTLYFINRGEEMTPKGGSKMKLNFTYLTGGYIKEGYGIAVRVNPDNITFQRYNTSGKYESLKTVKRIVPAFNCEKVGHKETEKVFDPKIKAFVFSCKNCKTALYERMSGDCDGNGMINSNDARMALRFSVNLDTPDSTVFFVADVDNDSVITAADARYILRKSVDLPNESIKWSPIPVDKNGNKTA